MTTVHHSRPTLDQRRAAHAWSFIQAIQKNSKLLKPSSKEPDRLTATDEGKKLGTEIKKLSTRIIASGIGQAFAFLHAKKAALLLEEVVVHWLLSNRPKQYDPNTKLNATNLIEKIVAPNSNSETLRDLTDETLAYLPWLSRFAEGVGLMERTDDQPGAI